MSIITSVHNHCSNDITCWVTQTIPSNLLADQIMWKGPQCMAIRGEDVDGLTEVHVYGTWPSRVNHNKQLEPHNPSDAEAAPFSPHAAVSQDVLRSLYITVNGEKVADFDDAVVPVSVKGTHAMQKIRWCVKFPGGRAWLECWIYLASGIVQFFGKVEFSDPTNSDGQLYEGTLVEIKFRDDSARPFFYESEDTWIEYGCDIPDGRGLPFSGLIAFGDPDDIPDIDGSIDGTLWLASSTPAWDDRLPPGLSLKKVNRLHQAWQSNVLPESMEQHPLTEAMYTHQTGGRYSFGFPFTEVFFDPSLIRVLRHAARCESFRPIQRLETTGEPWNAGNYEGMRLHNGVPMAGSYAFGKDPYDDGHGHNTWGVQGFAHCAEQDQFTLLCAMSDPISRDNIERFAEIAIAQVNYFTQPRFTHRYGKWLVCAMEAPINDPLKERLENRLVTWLAALQEHALSWDVGGAIQHPFQWNTIDGAEVQATIQNGLIGSLPMVMQMARRALTDPLLEHFKKTVRFTLNHMIIEDASGLFRVHWAVFRDGRTPMMASSHTQILRQCWPGLKWYEQFATIEEANKIEAIRVAIDDNSSEARRWLL